MNRPPDTLTTQALETVAREELLCSGDRVLVALSGGADSLALLVFLLEQKETLGLCEVAAVHVHHGLRGADADADEAFVRAQCLERGVPLTVEHADVAAEAAAHGEGIEEAGRRVRYACLQREAARFGARIATAHTRSDAVETVLLHLARGCGLAGLRGIPPQRDNIVRPLIDCTRQQVETFCAARGLEYRQDATNADTAYARNRVRHEVIPALTAINPRLSDAVGRLMAQARQDETYLQEQAAAALAQAALIDIDGRDGYDCARLAGCPASVRRRALRLLIEKAVPHGCTEGMLVRLEALLTAPGAVILPGGTQVCASQGRIVVLPSAQPTAPEPCRLPPGTPVRFGPWRVQLLPPGHKDFVNTKKIHKNLFSYSLNYAKIAGNCCIRCRQAGDTLCPAGRGIHKTVKKLCIEAKIPVQWRNSLPVVCDTSGVVCVCGLGCDERVRPAVSEESGVLRFWRASEEE